MSAPLPIGRAEHCDCTEGKKHRAKNVSIPRPGGDCAGQRQEGEQSEVARLGVHFRPPIRRGSDQAAPPLLRELMALNRECAFPRERTAGHLSGSDRATRCPTEGEKRRGATLLYQIPLIRTRGPIGAVRWT